MTLLELAERCEAAAGPDREIDARVHCAHEGLEFVLLAAGEEVYGDICDPADNGYGSGNKCTSGLLYARYPDHKNPATLGGGKRGNRVQGCTAPRYTSSLDAAMTLAEDDAISEHMDEAIERLGRAGWREGQYKQRLAQFFTASCLRARAAYDSGLDIQL
jgi:hypothetical protein